MNLYEYIHEFDAYDSLTLCLESIQETIAYANYQQSEFNRTSDMFTVFEGADPKSTQEKVNRNIFEKFGKKIRELIERIKEFGKWITDMISSILPGMKSDSEKAAEVLKENPALRDQIIMSYEKGEMSLKDIANLEKDVSAVMRLYEAGKIDEDTASGKIREATNKFNEKAAKVIKVTGTVAGVLAIATLVQKAAADCRKNNDGFHKIVEDFHRKYENTATAPGSKIGKVLSALSSALGFSAEETKNRISFADKVKKSINKFLKKNNPAATQTKNEVALGSLKTKIADAKSRLDSDKNNKDIKDTLAALKTVYSFFKRTGSAPENDAELNEVINSTKNGVGPTDFFRNKKKEADEAAEKAKRDAEYASRNAKNQNQQPKSFDDQVADRVNQMKINAAAKKIIENEKNANAAKNGGGKS